MARMLVIYKTPKDPVAFNRHYFDVHVPMASRLPGLRRYEVSRGTVVPLGGARDPYLIATLHFDSMHAIQAAFASDLGKQCAADRRLLAPNDDDVQLFLFESSDVKSAA